MKNINNIDKGADRYVVGKVKPFNQKNEMFKRPLWDSKLAHLRGEVARKKLTLSSKPGYRLQDESLVNAAWLLEDDFAKGTDGGRFGLYAWHPEAEFDFLNLQPVSENTLSEPWGVTQEIKKVASFFGAAEVGVCALDKRWLYSHAYFTYGNGREPIAKIEIPPD